MIANELESNESIETMFEWFSSMQDLKKIFGVG